MFKPHKMRFNGEWSLLAGNRVYELTNKLTIILQFDAELLKFLIHFREESIKI
jgi:hypothetical protein